MSVQQNTLATERMAVLLRLPLTSMTSASTAISIYTSMLGTNANLFGRYLALMEVKSATSTAAVEISVVKAADTSGGSVTAIGFVSYTNSNAYNNVWEFNIDGARIDTSNPFIALRVSSATSSALTVSGTLFGVDARYGPASDYNTSAVISITSL